MRKLQLFIIFTLFTSVLASADVPGNDRACTSFLSNIYKWIRHPIKMLRNEWAGLRMPEEVTSFDVAKFSAAKESYLSKLVPGADLKTLVKPKTFEEKIAFIEAIQEIRTKESLNFKQLYDDREFIKSKKIADMTIALDFDSGFSATKIEKFTSRLYRIAYDDPYALRNIFEKGYQGVSEEIFARIVKEKLVSKGIVEVAKDFGVLQDEKALERLVTFVKMKEVRITFNVGVNAATTAAGFPLPSPPGILPSQWLKLSDEFYNKAMLEGVDKAVATIETENKFIFKSEAGYDAFRKVYGTVVTGLFAYFVYEKVRQNIIEKEIEGPNSTPGHDAAFFQDLQKIVTSN